MRRLAIRDVELSDSVLIWKGERTVVDASTMWSPEVHAHPEQYNIHRFESQRGQSGYESRAQLVTTHPDQLVFGHGHFACPGRFFASNEIKIALCHLLLKYDWAVPPGHISEPSTIGGGLMIDPTTKVMYRRRREEFDLMMF